MLAVLAAVVVAGGLLTVTQVANASTWRRWGGASGRSSACPPTNPGGATQSGTASPTGSASKKRPAGQHAERSAGAPVGATTTTPTSRSTVRPAATRSPTCTPTSSGEQPVASPRQHHAAARDSGDRLLREPAAGARRFPGRQPLREHRDGEVGELAKNPTALIVEFPEDGVRVNTPFTVTISTRNIIRDRFLAAAQGGYYAETALLNAQGFARGHAHFGCRILANTNEAPAPTRSDFFVAIEDSAGSDTPDRITVNVTGLPRAGTASCAVWLGDNSHRLPIDGVRQHDPGLRRGPLRGSRLTAPPDEAAPDLRSGAASFVSYVASFLPRLSVRAFMNSSVVSQGASRPMSSARSFGMYQL